VIEAGSAEKTRPNCKTKEGLSVNSTNKGNQTAIVTGASSGMGLGITRVLLERGYRVVGNSRTISQSKELKASDNLVLVDGDISKKDTASTSSSIAQASTFPSLSPNIRPRTLK